MNTETLIGEPITPDRPTVRPPKRVVSRREVEWFFGLLVFALCLGVLIGFARWSVQTQSVHSTSYTGTLQTVTSTLDTRTTLPTTIRYTPNTAAHQRPQAAVVRQAAPAVVTTTTDPAPTTTIDPTTTDPTTTVDPPVTDAEQYTPPSCTASVVATVQPAGC